MSGYGTAPADDQVEITVFGTGCGEAIAVHLGENQWLLVDSCLHPQDKQPAALHYLRNIGVDPGAVRAILASHWHDDHIQGIAALASACPSAALFVPGVFTDDEALIFVAAYGGQAASPQTRGTKELFRTIFNSGAGKAIPVNQCAMLLETTVSKRKVRVLSLSPTPQALVAWIRRMTSYLPVAGQEPINHAPELEQNIAAVALHIDFGDDAVILGSDLENDTNYGWPLVLADTRCNKLTKASAYKVSHHGSRNGDLPALWTTLLANRPIAGMTPYTRSNLPRLEDRQRIRGLTSAAFISSNGSKRPEIEREQLRRMNAVCTNLVKVDSGFGATRFRKRFGEKEWTPELFDRAGQL